MQTSSGKIAVRRILVMCKACRYPLYRLESEKDLFPGSPYTLSRLILCFQLLRIASDNVLFINKKAPFTMILFAKKLCDVVISMKTAVH